MCQRIQKIRSTKLGRIRYSLDCTVNLFREGESKERKGILRRPWRHGKERFVLNWIHRMIYEIALLCFGGNIPPCADEEWEEMEKERLKSLEEK